MNWLLIADFVAIGGGFVACVVLLAAFGDAANHGQPGKWGKR